MGSWQHTKIIRSLKEDREGIFTGQDVINTNGQGSFILAVLQAVSDVTLQNVTIEGKGKVYPEVIGNTKLVSF